jgi:tRNA splicing ligase
MIQSWVVSQLKRMEIFRSYDRPFEIARLIRRIWDLISKLCTNPMSIPGNDETDNGIVAIS